MSRAFEAWKDFVSHNFGACWFYADLLGDPDQHHAPMRRWELVLALEAEQQLR